MSYTDPLPREKRCRAVPSVDGQGPVPSGSTAVMTEDWHYVHDIYGNATCGTKGTEFVVDAYIPEEASDSGFAFYWGHSFEGQPVLCPADLCTSTDMSPGGQEGTP